MECPEFMENVSAYIDKDLRFPEILKCEKHMKHCLHCNQSYERVKFLIEKLNNLPRVKTGAGFMDKVFKKLEIKKIQKPKITRTRWRLPDLKIAFEMSINWSNN
tara:strand:+ start:378 stop:689 length:312 start_codon:yes stop_codon:yes gene_type:complete